MYELQSYELINEASLYFGIFIWKLNPADNCSPPIDLQTIQILLQIQFAVEADLFAQPAASGLHGSNLQACYFGNIPRGEFEKSHRAEMLFRRREVGMRLNQFVPELGINLRETGHECRTIASCKIDHFVMCGSRLHPPLIYLCGERGDDGSPSFLPQQIQ